jgi:hypothetical protein
MKLNNRLIKIKQKHDPKYLVGADRFLSGLKIRGKMLRRFPLGSCQQIQVAKWCRSFGLWQGFEIMAPLVQKK